MATGTATIQIDFDPANLEHRTYHLHGLEEPVSPFPAVFFPVAQQAQPVLRAALNELGHAKQIVEDLLMASSSRPEMAGKMGLKKINLKTLEIGDELISTVDLYVSCNASWELIEESFYNSIKEEFGVRLDFQYPPIIAREPVLAGTR